MSLGKRKCACCNCLVEADCADNGWCLYDPKNKKCPNWLAGVKDWHRFLKEEKRDLKLGYFDYNL